MALRAVAQTSNGNTVEWNSISNKPAVIAAGDTFTEALVALGYAPTASSQLLGRNSAGSPMLFLASASSAANTIPIRATNGRVKVGTATDADDAVTLAQLRGEVVSPIASTTTTITLGTTQYTVLANATGGAITINLPPAAANIGKIYNLKKIDSTANTVTIDPNAVETIDGAATRVLTAQWQSVQIQCDGTAWFVL